MVVYSGTKTAYLPKMMTLYEQCIRVLQNNIDCEECSGFTVCLSVCLLLFQNFLSEMNKVAVSIK